MWTSSFNKRHPVTKKSESATENIVKKIGSLRSDHEKSGALQWPNVPLSARKCKIMNWQRRSKKSSENSRQDDEARKPLKSVQIPYNTSPVVS